MAMDYIHKDVNKTLLVFLLVIAVVIVGLVVFYSLNFKAINKEYNQKVTELNSTYSSLAGYQTTLNKTKTELQLKTEREQGLSGQYTDVKQERDFLQNERDKLKSDKAVLEDSLNKKSDQLSSLTTLYLALNTTYFNQRAEIERLNLQVSSLQSQLSKCTPSP